MTTKNKNRAITLDQLPIPQSKVEEFLEYLCYNGVGGGGTGGLNEAQVQAMIDELFKDATFDETTNIVTFTKEDGTTKEVDLSPLINNILRPKKSFIICVAGQSNAVGYDESPVSTYISKNRNPNRLRQLGIYDDNNLKNIELGHHAHSFQDMRNNGTTNPANPTLQGTKGIHLPLGNLLLSQIPEDYEVLFVSATYGGTGFNSGNTGSYNETSMLPVGDRLKWGVDTPYYKAMRDRIRYALDLNPENVFGGVVWIQGENDNANAAAHYAAFQEMTQAFFDYFNREGYDNRVAKRIWDKDLWYNVETVAYWYGVGQCQQIWDNYKAWNPNTYVDIPRNTDSNAVNGTGATSQTRTSHYGNDAYTKVVAPRVLEKMIVNNGLFNNKVPVEIPEQTPTTPSDPIEILGFDRTQDPTERDLVEADITPYGDKSSFTLTDGLLSFDETPESPKSIVDFGSSYKIDFEVTKSIYWFAFRGDYSTKVSLIAFGGTYTHRVAEVDMLTNTANTLLGTVTQLQRSLEMGDRVSIYKNSDGTISFYLKKYNKDKYEFWFTFNPSNLNLTSEDKPLFGLFCGITAGELMTGYDAKDILKDSVIQMNQGYINNPTLDKHIYNTAIDVAKKVATQGITAVTDVTFNEDDKKIVVEKNTGTSNDILLTKYADVTENNYFSNVVVASDMSIASKDVLISYSSAFTTYTSDLVVGIPSFIVKSDTVVSRIELAISGTAYNVGDYVKDIKVLVFKNVTNGYELVESMRANEVVRYGNHTTQGHKSLFIEMQKSWDDDVFFVVGCHNLAYGGSARVPVLAININSLPNVGTIIPTVTTQSGANYNALYIYSEDKEVAVSDRNNTFTGTNRFKEYSPVVEKDFVLKAFGNTYTTPHTSPANNYYWVNLDHYVEANTEISHLLLPIFNSQVGDTIQATYFIVDKTTNSIVDMDIPKEYTVEDVKYLDTYCIKIPITETYAFPVAFGFSVTTKTVGGRRIGMRYSIYNGADNVSWGSATPILGTPLTPNSQYIFPYQVIHHTESPVLTRYDLEHSTVPNVTRSVVGELKTLSYDSGEVAELNGCRWLRCDGQSVSSADYGELYEKIGSQFNSVDEKEVPSQSNQEVSDEIGNIDDDIIVDMDGMDDSLEGVEIAVDFNLPTNPLPIGYLYICVK